MNYKDIINCIKKDEIKNVYLFYGEEVYLINDALEKLKRKLVDPSLEQLNYTILDAKEISVEKIVDTCETLPFMSEKKLVYIKGLDIFKGKSKNFSEEDQKYIVDYIKKIPESATVVFYDVSSIDTRRKIVKEIKKHGDVVEFTKLNDNEFNKWIKKIFKSYEKSIEVKELSILKNNLDYLGKNASRNLLDVENEVKKIISFMGEEEKLEQDHIEKILSSSFQNNIFKLIDSVEKRNPSESIKRLNHILGQGEPILKVLTTLGNQMKNILSVKLLLDEGYTSKNIASKLSLHPFVVSKCAAQSKRFSIEELRGILNTFLDVDIMIKTSKMDEKMAMEMLVMEICK